MSFVPTAIAGLNIGVDIFFHLKIAESWATGNLGMFSSVVMNENHFPYPPLFHFLLVPGVWLGVESAWASVLQVAFLPLAVASFMFLVYKLMGARVAFFGGLLVLGSFAYFDRVVQPQPQAIDFILLPMSYLWFLTAKNRYFSVASVLMVWNHGIVSLSALGGTLLLKLKRHDWRTLTVVALGSSFILAISAWYILGGLGNYGPRVDTNQELYFWSNPLFVPLYLRFLIVGFPIAAYQLVRSFRGTPLTELSKLCLLSIGSLAVMIPMWADRWLQYSTIPLALLTLEYINSQKLGRRFWLEMMVVVFFMVAFYSWLLF